MKEWLKKGETFTAATARRITGFSTPLGGIQLADPGPSDAKIVRGFLLFLEDRRVLYNSSDLEVVSQVENSIHEIRKQCTEALQVLPAKAFAIQPIRAIREAGRRFHDDQCEEFRFFDRHRGYHEGSPGFFTALGALRATIGYQVVMLVAHYDIDVEGDLAAVLPRPEPEP